MAYYNANDVVRLTRKAEGITQEELCFGICDVSTLSKMENGHFRVKQATYRKLMAKMGRMTEKKYAICLDKDGRLSEERLGWERAYKNQDYEAAEQFLRKMQGNADDNILTKQYLTRAEALIDYRMGRIHVEEMIRRIDATIRMTVPDYEKYLNQDKVFPFMKEELLALMSLGNGYRTLGNNEQGVLMYETVLKCLEAGYIAEPDNISMEVTVRYNIIRMYSAMGKHMEALTEIENCLKLCRERDYSHLVVSLLSSKAHNYVRLVEKGIWEKECLQDAKKLLQQAYSLAAARAEGQAMSTISKYYRQHFVEDGKY